MTHYILLAIGLAIFWAGIEKSDEVHRLALASAAIFPLSWGYFSSPSIFQCLSGILILGVYQIYISYG